MARALPRRRGRPTRRARGAGVRIREERLRAGLSQGELGARLGVRPGTVARWETGSAVPLVAALRLVGVLPGLALAELAQ